MYSAQAKIVKPAGEKVDELESTVSQVSFSLIVMRSMATRFVYHDSVTNECLPSHHQALLELEMNSDLKPQLRELNISAAKEVDAGTARKAVIIYVPPPQLKQWQKLQTRVVRELEKKFSGKHVVFIAKRTILAKPTRKLKTQQKQKRPRR